MKKWYLRNIKEDRLLKELLRIRNIDEGGEKEYLYPDYENGTFDPFLFNDMEKAVTRLRRAIDENQPVIIFADYDADGTGGAVIMSDFFNKIGFSNFEVYIPDRYTEGYGLQMNQIKGFIQKNTELLIAIDCGITSFSEIEYAEKNGCNVIILDHHIVPPAWPPAYAILDPKKEDEKYPYKFLCGTALSFKLVDAMLRRYEWGFNKEWQKWLLDVVAISTVADMVPLSGENRVLTSFGIKVLRKNRRLGLRMLNIKAGVNTDNITADDIGFSISPRINAASRMAHATISYNLLTTEDSEEAERLSLHIEEINLQRKKKVEEILKEAEEMIKKDKKISDIIFLGNKLWPAGVLGIVANRLSDKYNKTCFIWGSGGNDYKGSCRGGGEINVVELMKGAGEGILLDYGGHSAAGGFSVLPERLGEFKKNIQKIDLSDYTIAKKDIIIDAELSLSDVNYNFFNEIKMLEPHGIENPRPVFLFRKAIPISVREMGNSGRGHIKVLLNNKNNMPVLLIGFFMGSDVIDTVKKGIPVDIAGVIEENCWNGKKELRIRIIELKLSDEGIIETI